MYRKLIMASMTAAAFAAFVVPSAASASPTLTRQGQILPVGTEITGTNTGNITFTGAFNVICSSAHVVPKVTENSGTKIKLEVPANGLVFSGTAGACTSNQGGFTTSWSKLCLETVKGTDNVLFTGCGASASFTTNGCKFSTASFTGTFTTNSDATVNVSEQEFKRAEGGFLCPASWRLDFDLDFTAVGGETIGIS